jgi:DNA repair photolyase
MRWQGQELGVADAAALPGLEQLNGLVRSVTTPDFADITFHEVMCKSALNHVPGASAMPFDWTVNPYRGCSHACSYCFARGTHEYLELDAGRDFDTQIIVKINVADVLEKELRRGTWMRDPVMLGTNTDPYQRAEGRYALMPGIVSALTESGTPFSILTKGTLLRRDLPLLREAAASVPVSIAMSVAVFDDELQRLVEPGTPSAAARLATVRAATDAGFRVTVFLMPILPHLTDSIPSLDHALAQIRDAGAVRVVFGALHLRPGAKQWFLQWIAREHPELVSLTSACTPEHRRPPRRPTGRGCPNACGRSCASTGSTVWPRTTNPGARRCPGSRPGRRSSPRRAGARPRASRASSECRARPCPTGEWATRWEAHNSCDFARRNGETPVSRGFAFHVQELCAGCRGCAARSSLYAVSSAAVGMRPASSRIVSSPGRTFWYGASISARSSISAILRWR